METSVLQKIPATLLALLLYYALPLIGRFDLLLTTRVAITIFFCTVVYMTQSAATTDQVNQEQDHHSMKILIGATTLSQVSIVAEWAYFRTNHLFQWDMTTLVGLVLMIAGVGLRLWAIRTLRQFFSNQIHIRADHQLVQTGPFAVLRHPAYAGAYLLAIGIGVFFGAWVGLVMTVFVLGTAYRYRIIHEESALETCFGERYRIYRKRTWRMIPFVW